MAVIVFSMPNSKCSEILESRHSVRISSISFSKSCRRFSRLSVGKEFMKQISKQSIAKFSPFTSLSFAKAPLKVSKVVPFHIETTCSLGKSRDSFSALVYKLNKIKSRCKKDPKTSYKSARNASTPSVNKTLL